MRTFAQSALSAAALLVFSAGAASAHTAYLSPQDFTPDATRVSIEAAFATQFFTPTIALSGPEFHAVTPDGARSQFSSMSVVAPRTTLELAVVVPGTYRVTTGDIVGPVANMVAADGSWRAMQPGEVVPPDVQTTTLQTVTLAETYVTRGRPSDGVLDDTTGRLNIRPVTHPNRIARAEGFVVELQFDGQPFPNMPFVLYGNGDVDSDLDRAFVTGADGRATITFDQPGTYVLAVRHRAAAPTGSEAAVRSYTSSLTFEVYDVLPELPPEEQPERRRRRTRLNNN